MEGYDEDDACRRLADRKRLWERSVVDRRAYLARQVRTGCTFASRGIVCAVWLMLKLMHRSQAFPYDVIARVEEEYALNNAPGMSD